MIKMSFDLLKSLPVGSVLYNWKTQAYVRVKANWNGHRQFRRLTIGQLRESDECWWTSYISEDQLGQWRLVSELENESC